MTIWDRIRTDFPSEKGLRWLVVLITVWFLLNIALSTGWVVEGNPFMAKFIDRPAVAMMVKMLAAFCGVKVIEKLAVMNLGMAIRGLAIVNGALVVICGNNLMLYIMG